MAESALGDLTVSEVGIGSGVALALAFGGKTLMEKFLGPTAEYWGGELRRFNEKGFESIKRIIKIAIEKSGDSIEREGSVHPLVMRQIIEEGYFCEDGLRAEYLGGVLASSRVSNLRDDRAVSWINVLKRLTTYQIRTHYLLYHSLHQTLTKVDFSPAPPRDRREDLNAIENNSLVMRIDLEKLARELELTEGEDLVEILRNVRHGLGREGLISNWKIDDRNVLHIRPTEHGITLFLSANGFGTKGWTSFISERFSALPGLRSLQVEISHEHSAGDAVWL